MKAIEMRLFGLGDEPSKPKLQVVALSYDTVRIHWLTDTDDDDMSSSSRRRYTAYSGGSDAVRTRKIHSTPFPVHKCIIKREVCMLTTTVTIISTFAVGTASAVCSVSVLATITITRFVLVLLLVGSFEEQWRTCTAVFV
jgi:hypothetical protein